MSLYNVQERINSLLHISQKLLDGIPLSELYVDELFNSSNIILFWKNYKGDYLACNDKFAEISGIIQAKNIVGRNDYELPWRKEQTDKFVADDKIIMELSCPRLNMLETALQFDGKETLNLTSKFPIYSSDRKRMGLLGIVTPITAINGQVKMSPFNYS